MTGHQCGSPGVELRRGLRHESAAHGTLARPARGHRRWQWAEVKRVEEMLPGANITIRVHKISWKRDTHVDVPITFAVLVSKRHGPFTLRREYLPDFG